jgi:alpha-tubulin suppressor-like RCC1 family protein
MVADRSLRTAVLTLGLSTVLVVSLLSGVASAGKTPPPPSPATVTWTGGGSVVDGASRTLKTVKCDAANTPYLAWVLSGSKATSASILIAGQSAQSMGKPQTDKLGYSTFKYTWSPGTAINLEALYQAVTASYNDAKNKAVLTIGQGCLGATVPAAPTVTAITAGGFHSCARMSDGTARCWGVNFSGQLGDNTTTYSTVPVTVVDPTDTAQALTGIASITAGSGHTCAVMTNGTARCWGVNSYGQLGNNTDTNSTVPVTVVDPTDTTQALTGIASITADGLHTCAVMTNGTARCWGGNDVGQLGNNTTSTSAVPVTVLDPDGTDSLLDVASIDAGANGTCAVMTDTTARCWGEGNGYANGSLLPVTPIDPASGQALTGITNISAGTYYGCAALSDNTARCWNYNVYGQLGDNTTTNSTGVVTVVDPTNTAQALTGIASITAGGLHTCAVMTNGTARCWGRNLDQRGDGGGQLGNGTTTNSNVPVTVTGLG